MIRQRGGSGFSWFSVVRFLSDFVPPLPQKWLHQVTEFLANRKIERTSSTATLRWLPFGLQCQSPKPFSDHLAGLPNACNDDNITTLLSLSFLIFLTPEVSSSLRVLLPSNKGHLMPHPLQCLYAAPQRLGLCSRGKHQLLSASDKGSEDQHLHRSPRGNQ